MDELQFDRLSKNEILTKALRKSILTGAFKPGDRMMSQNEMSQKYGISPNTVREAIASLVQEGLVRRIRGKGTFVADDIKGNHLTIALLIPHVHYRPGMVHDIGHDRSALVVEAVDDECRLNNIEMLLCLNRFDANIEAESLRRMLNRQVDGIIAWYIGGEENRRYLDDIQAAGIPLVLIDRYERGFDSDYVVSDNFNGARELTQRLIGSGYGNVVFVSDQLETSSIRERVAGYECAMKEHCIKTQTVQLDSRPNITVMELQKEAYLMGLQLCSELKPPFSVFGSSAIILSGIWTAMKERKIQHDSFALACFDEMFTSIPDDVLRFEAVQQFEQMSTEAVRIIMRKWGGRRVHDQITLDPDVREIGSRVLSVAG